MDPRRVLLFRTVARCGSLSAAARELHLTQSAVSQQLRHLEREAGSPLFIRSTRGITLTEAGAVLLGRADAVSSELHMASEELATLANLRAGKVRLIAFPSAASTVVPLAIQELQRAAVGIEVRFVEAEPPQATAAVQAGEADLAVVFDYDNTPGPDRSQVCRQAIASETMHLVLPAQGRTTPPLITSSWLATQNWIAGCPDCRHHLVERCRSAGFEPRLMHESDDYVVLQALVAHGLGVAVLPQLALSTFRHPGVRVTALPEFGERTVSVIHRPGAEEVPATRALMAQLRLSAATVTRQPVDG